ncbi:MAG TPA: hypothetical protein VHZ31_02315 [Solirubrobacteraceae bacterium]|jgi:hypothetical protein|nr:hypothetical protein [Solirubrobacteraceae bacterium]
MRANRQYRLLYTRSSRRPAQLDPTRIDHIEVVDIASGEVVLFWDLAAPDAARRARRLREDLSVLDVADFVDRWCAVDLDELDAIHRADD